MQKLADYETNFGIFTFLSKMISVSGSVSTKAVCMSNDWNRLIFFTEFFLPQGFILSVPSLFD